MRISRKAAGALKLLLGAAVAVQPAIGGLLLLAGAVDFLRVRRFKRPIFCLLPAESRLEDGVSGTYVSFGYSFELKGNGTPEDEPSGVTAYRAKILNTPVMAGVRK